MDNNQLQVRKMKEGMGKTAHVTQMEFFTSSSKCGREHEPLLPTSYQLLVGLLLELASDSG